MFLKSFLCLTLVAGSFATVNNQACDGYATLTKGTKYQLITYDNGNMNKVSSTSSYEVIGSKSNGATLHLLTVDAKGKETMNVDYDITCSGGSVIIDRKTILTKEMGKSITDPDVKADVTGNNLEIPNNLNIGQSLPDSKIDINFTAGNVKLSVNTDVHNRKVIGQETVTVPAGSFDCFIISDETTTKSLVTKTTTHKIWIAKGVGTVKQETYNKKGKLEKLQLLTSFKK